jgi:hypothetical protein
VLVQACKATLDAHWSVRAKAAAVEHAIHDRITVNLASDSEYPETLFKRLTNIIQPSVGQWDLLG